MLHEILTKINLVGDGFLGLLAVLKSAPERIKEIPIKIYIIFENKFRSINVKQFRKISGGNQKKLTYLLQEKTARSNGRFL